MRHHHSVLHGLLKHVPWAVFDRLVDAHGADRRVRRLTTRSQLVALLYGQLAGAVSLREIEGALASHAARLYHLGARSVSRSTLADANAKRPAAVFAELLGQMLASGTRGLRRQMGEAVRLLDSTTLRLVGPGSGWARVRADFAAAKLHVLYDPETDRPLGARVTPATVNDITVAKSLPIEPGATYVFDLGYYDYAFPREPPSRLPSLRERIAGAAGDGRGCTAPAAGSSPGSRPTRRSPASRRGRSRPARRSSPTASAACRPGSPPAAATRSRPRSASFWSASTAAGCCAC